MIYSFICSFTVRKLIVFLLLGSCSYVLNRRSVWASRTCSLYVKSPFILLKCFCISVLQSCVSPHWGGQRSEAAAPSNEGVRLSSSSSSSHQLMCLSPEESHRSDAFCLSHYFLSLSLGRRWAQRSPGGGSCCGEKPADGNDPSSENKHSAETNRKWPPHSPALLSVTVLGGGGHLVTWLVFLFVYEEIIINSVIMTSSLKTINIYRHWMLHNLL